MRASWKFNCWTGDHTLRLGGVGDRRLVRMGREPPYLYLAEWWGRYGIGFPITGGWASTPRGALRALGLVVFLTWLHGDKRDWPDPP